MDSRIGLKVRIILVGGFHYSGTILEETEISVTILDKFQNEVSLLKNSIQVLEVTK